MQIRVIATGSTKLERFFRKWGVSFIINNDTLFDVFGKPSTFRRQLNKLSIDVAKIRNIVLSHDDWDHVSGLWYILERNKDVVVHICQNFSQDIKDKIKSYNVKIVEVRDFAEISSNIYSTGEMTGIAGERSIVQGIELRTRRPFDRLALQSYRVAADDQREDQIQRHGER